MNRKSLQVEDLMQCREWIGKNVTETGVSIDTHDFVLGLDGMLWGKRVRGWLSTDYKHVVEEIHAKIEGTSFRELYQFLEKEYGSAADSYMVPYAESQGGAIEGFVFEDGKFTITIERASKRDYVSVKISALSNF